MLAKEDYISFRATTAESEQIAFLMEKLDRNRSAVIRYAIKLLYNELRH